MVHMHVVNTVAEKEAVVVIKYLGIQFLWSGKTFIREDELEGEKLC